MTDIPTAHVGVDSAAWHAIVLAAGAGARFGGGKLLASWAGRPLIAHAVAAACAAPVGAVTLVLGADPSVGAPAQAEATRPLRLVHAADWAEGLAASLRAGFASVPAEAHGVFVFLGDMPRVPHSLAGRLPPALPSGVRAAAPVCGGRRGHPVLVARSLFPSVATLSGDAGLGALLAGLGSGLALVDTDDDGVLFDVDARDAEGLDA